MSNPSKKIKTVFGSIACLDGDNQHQRNKRKIAKQPAKNLLDLNVDCLFEIFERVDVMDLANVAQSCEFLRDITLDIFRRKYKSLKLNYSSDIISVEQAVQAKLLFKTFGSSIVELDIKLNLFDYDRDRTADILHAIMTHCTSLKSLKLAEFDIPDDEFWFILLRKLFARLEKLHLHFFDIRCVFRCYDFVTTPSGNAINCFDNCTSLRELKLSESFFFYDVILQNTFPRLQHFILEHQKSIFSYDRDDSIKGFILRHPHLKTFSLTCEYDYLSVAAANLRSLETFGFDIEFGYPPGSPSSASVESLAKFRNLKELRCFHVGSEDNMSRLLKILPKLTNTLEVLDLQHGRGNRDFIAVVNSLQKLKVVRLAYISIKDTPRDDLKNLLRATTVILE